MKSSVQIEKIILKHIRTEGRSITWLCDELGWQRQKWYRFLKSGIIDVQDLFALSRLLRHDYFQYFSEKLEAPKNGV